MTWSFILKRHGKKNVLGNLNKQTTGKGRQKENKKENGNGKRKEATNRQGRGLERQKGNPETE